MSWLIHLIMRSDIKKNSVILGNRKIYYSDIACNPESPKATFFALKLMVFENWICGVLLKKFNPFGSLKSKFEIIYDPLFV